MLEPYEIPKKVEIDDFGHFFYKLLFLLDFHKKSIKNQIGPFNDVGLSCLSIGITEKPQKPKLQVFEQILEKCWKSAEKHKLEFISKLAMALTHHARAIRNTKKKVEKDDFGHFFDKVLFFLIFTKNLRNFKKSTGRCMMLGHVLA